MLQQIFSLPKDVTHRSVLEPLFLVYIIGSTDILSAKSSTRVSVNGSLLLRPVRASERQYELNTDLDLLSF